MKNRSIAICLSLFATFLLFSGCSGGNSLAGGHISFVDDTNPFVGTWICATTRQEDYGTHTYNYEKMVFTKENVTYSYIDVVDWGLNTQHTVELSFGGTWYFLNDGSHIYIKPTSHNRVSILPAEYDTTDYRNSLQALADLVPLNVETHYTYVMNDAKSQFTITNVDNTTDVTVWDRY